jgi:WD40 repeat protein
MGNVDSSDKGAGQASSQPSAPVTVIDRAAYSPQQTSWHTAHVTTVTFSPDGLWLATGGDSSQSSSLLNLPSALINDADCNAFGIYDASALIIYEAPTTFSTFPHLRR